jgi:hypothetical protein
MELPLSPLIMVTILIIFASMPTPTPYTLFEINVNHNTMSNINKIA